MVIDGGRRIGFADQREFSFRFDWGMDGLGTLAPVAAVVVIVDVLRFTSAVSAALEGGSTVLPFPWAHEDADAYAERHDAVLAGRREDGGPSLSPTDMLTLESGSRLVLPSPNGAALAFAARDLGAPHVMAGCLRNAASTARVAVRLASTADRGAGVIAVIAAGERWPVPGSDSSMGSGSLRPAVEDLIGAGGILAALDPSGAVAAPRCSPEARVARAAFLDARPRLMEHLANSASGRELIDRGWEDDVATSAALDVTAVAALLVDGAFVAA